MDSSFSKSLVVLFCFFTFLMILPSSNSVYFKKTRFDPEATDILYQGDAVPSVGAVALINQVTYLCRVGWATYAERIPLWDSGSGKLTDFTTHFSFIIDTQGRPKYGHGLAFFLAPVGSQIPPNSAGGFLGLFNTTTTDSSQNHIVMVEFDSFSNPDWDPTFEHVGINNNSLASAVYTAWNASYHSGDTADAWITYNATTKNFSVSWTYQTTKNPQENTSLSYIINLSEVLPEWVTIGFSAATGQYGESNTLQSWEFRSSLDIKPTGGKNRKKVDIIVGVITASGCILIAGVIFKLVIFWRRKKIIRRKNDNAVNLESINEDLERGSGPRKFSYEELVSATNNFSDDRKLGEGGFGAVYKGYLNDLDIMVAVKKISRGSRQGKRQYVTEVKTIGQLRHRNLVQLVGWCHDRGEFLLVYEFMPKGSLDFHLFGRNTLLTWSVRYKISLGLASALLYLHEEWEKCVVHRDVKSSNVMLDSSFSAKLGDFGLARLMDHELGPQTTGLAGTFGYLAPEYISTGRASRESDVYSYMVVALEIATGKKAGKAVDHDSEMSLVEWVWGLYGCRNHLSAVDKRLNMDFDERQVERLMVVGLWCAHPDRNLRPSIRKGIQLLNFETEIPNLPPKMPVAMYQLPAPSCSSHEPSITDSILEVGR